MPQQRTVQRALLRDGWFWAAVSGGVAAAWVIAVLADGPLPWPKPWTVWRELIWLAVLYPVVEEWLFRGVLQPWWYAKNYGSKSCCAISLANLLTTLLFASLHLFVHTPIWALLVIVPSLMYGAFRDRYRSILPGTLLHCLYNFSYFSFAGIPPG